MISVDAGAVLDGGCLDESAYIGWNKCTRHQLIVAHMILVEAVREYQDRLADALGEPKHRSLGELINEAIARLQTKT